MEGFWSKHQNINGNDYYQNHINWSIGSHIGFFSMNSMPPFFVYIACFFESKEVFADLVRGKSSKKNPPE